MRHSDRHQQIGLLAFCLLCFCAALPAQPVAFQLQNHADCPLTITAYTASILRVGATRRQFVTLKNVSGRAISGLLLQQTIPEGALPKIIALESVSVIFGSRETKRLSIDVGDVWNLLQNSAKSGAVPSKPVLSVVEVDFLDGTSWRAPIGPGVENRDSAGRRP